MKKAIITLFLMVFIGTGLFIAQAARWYYYKDNKTMYSESKEVIVSIDSVPSPKPNIEYFYNITEIRVISTSTFPFLKDTIKDKIRNPVKGYYNYRKK